MSVERSAMREGGKASGRAQLSTLNAQPFYWPVRVYYEDTDSGGVVYYANYLKFLERARTEWLRALGFSHGGLAVGERAVFVVRSLAVDYVKACGLDDTLQVTVELIRVGASLMIVAQQVICGGEVRVNAEVKLACVDRERFRPMRIPQAVVRRIGTIS